MLKMHVMEYHNDKATLPKVTQGTMNFNIILCLQSAAHFCRPARADLRCDAIAEFGPAEVKFEQGLDDARCYWLAAFLPPARPDPKVTS